MSIEAKLRALVVYYSFTRTTAKVADAMKESLEAKGYEVEHATIEFTDPHWTNVSRPSRCGFLPRRSRRS